MLGQCLLVGGVAAGGSLVAVLFVAVSSYLFFIGLEGLKRARLRQRANDVPFYLAFPRASSWFLLASAGLGLVVVVGWGRWVLFFWAALSLVCVGAYAALLFRRQERSAGAEWLGILGITLSAGVAWSAGTGRLDPVAFYVWALCFLYFAGSVPYVRLRVKQMKSGRGTFTARLSWARNALAYGTAALGLAAIGAWVGTYPWLMVVPFVLMLGKLLWVVLGGEVPRSLTRVGFAEVFYSTVFTVIAVVAFWPF